MTQTTYEDRLRSQIEQYAETVDMQALPSIYFVWSHNYIAPGLDNVFGTTSIDVAYAMAYIEARKTDTGAGRILSIGCGDGMTEIRIAKALLERDVRDFVFVCADLSPILLANLKADVAREGLADHFETIEIDLNFSRVEGTFDMVMANHALHHIQELETVFQFSHDCLKDGGIFATCDMIGRNGHMRWKETAVILQALWPTLEPKQQYNAQLKRIGDKFLDHDCSQWGFEGIRAQDILPLLLKYFHPYKFFGTGGFVDVIVDRGFGHAYDINNEKDVSFIRYLADLNDIFLDAGVVKPTWMMAYFTKDNRGEHFFRDRRAINSTRGRDGDPAWTRFYADTEHT